MSLTDIKESIKKSQFLLDFQKDKIIDMLNEDEDSYDLVELTNCILHKLFDMSVEDLSPNERVLLDQALEDYYVK